VRVYLMTSLEGGGRFTLTSLHNSNEEGNLEVREWNEIRITSCSLEEEDGRI
jgi:hypothetical protein